MWVRAQQFPYSSRNSPSSPTAKHRKLLNNGLDEVNKPAKNTMAPKETNIAVSLLSRAHSPDTTNRIFTEKVKQRPLHLKPTAPNNAQHVRRLERERSLLKRKKKLKPAPLSSHQKRALCLYDIPKSAQKYSTYEPLSNMWQGYIQEVLGENCMPVSSTTVARLCSADFHGADLEVVRSRCVSRVGVRGIVVKDSKFAFEVVTKNDRVKLLPKEHTIFRFTVPKPVNESRGSVGGEESVATKDMVFELHGGQFIFRSADRANRKFKSHFLPDL
jgi:ribonuclease P protein subunit POP4